VNASEAAVGKYEPDHRNGKGGNFEWVPFRPSMNPKSLDIQMEASQVMVDDSRQDGH
jgi:hypothetical protein